MTNCKQFKFRGYRVELMFNWDCCWFWTYHSYYWSDIDEYTRRLCLGPIMINAYKHPVYPAKD